jgi:hypothetical protein
MLKKNKIIYLFKVQGKTKIPDYVQLRDENYTLLAYFRADRPEKALIKYGFEPVMEEIKAAIDALPFGKMHKIEL